MFDDKILFSFTGPWGVRVEIGQSLIYLIGLLVFMGGDLLHSLTFAAMLVFSIYLHELGHAWGALIQGIPVRRVMLYGGGGFCEAGRSVSRYEDELFTICGPLVNLALWAISGILMYAIWAYTPETMAWNWVWGQLWYFAQLNLILFCLNLFPVLPLDGGRLFLLLLCRLMQPRRAAHIAGGVGLVMSVAWIPAMIFLYVTFGWALLFIPPIRPNYIMLRYGVTGGARPV